MKQYLKKQEGVSTPLATKWRPRFSSNDLVRSEAGENPDILIDGVWYNSTNGSELITNGTFDTDTSGWISSNSTLSVLNGVIKIQLASTGVGEARQSFTTEVGKLYTLKYESNFSSPTNGTGINIGTTAGGSDIVNTNSSTSPNNGIVTFTATSTTTYLSLWLSYDTNEFAYFDNITCYETNIEPDTAYTTPQTYLPLVANVDTEGNIVDIDSFDVPTLVEKSITADTVTAETKGKNSCTAWVNFDGTTTPPTIRDSYNVSQVIRTATGSYDVYFEEEMDNLNYCYVCDSNSDGIFNFSYKGTVGGRPITSTKKSRIEYIVGDGSTTPAMTDLGLIMMQVFGGKN